MSFLALFLVDGTIPTFFAAYACKRFLVLTPEWWCLANLKINFLDLLFSLYLLPAQGRFKGGGKEDRFLLQTSWMTNHILI
jgi:hypothetical protein